jgi:AcrR family transcriptional regulator
MEEDTQMEPEGKVVGAAVTDPNVPVAVVGRRKRQSRIEQSEAIRTRLFEAAADVVGEVGYAEASVALITQKAGVAQGTFYNYFESRQDLLEQLLPALGERMLAHVRTESLGGKSFAELEERSLRAFFSFLRETPPFYRILNEAENFAPNGYKRHFANVASGYMKFLRRSLHEGEFTDYSEQELEVIAYILMAARGYLALRYLPEQNGESELPKWVVDTYMKFVRHGLEGVSRDATSDRRPGRGKRNGQGEQR